MRNLTGLLLLFVLVVGMAGCGQKESSRIIYDKNYIDEINEIRKEASLYMMRNWVPGAAFTIMKDGKIIYSEAMGEASKDLKVETSRDTKFRIGEVSELFTSLIYQKMVAEGLLHPDSSVQHYLPDFPEKEYALNLEHLVYHASGIRAHDTYDDSWKALNNTITEGLENFKNGELQYYPGYDQTFSIFNYNLLGAIMEKVSGKRFGEILISYVTDTLGLEHTVVDNPFIPIENRTNFFDYNIVSQVVNADFYDLRHRAPSSGMLSSAEDLAKFGNAFLYSEQFTEAFKEELFKPYELLGGSPSIIGKGWYVMEDRMGREVYGRYGHCVGGGAALIVYPEEKLVIAGAINVTGDHEEVPVFKLAGFLLDDEEEQNTGEVPEEQQEKADTIQ